MKRRALLACLAGMVLALGPSAMAVSIEWVTVGDPGNVGELSGQGAGGFGPDRICGAVDYTYRIGKYEVTNAQYAEFLNSVATVGDPHGLYSMGMGSTYGGIERTGTEGNHSYGPKGGDANWINRPVNHVTFWDACRFANWLHNGQPVGVQDNSTTEDGAYFLNGVTNPTNTSITRRPDAKVWIPSEDEWYKAAYYKGGGTNAGYWDYPTASNTPPTAEAPTGTDIVNGSANYYGYVAGAPYYINEVGAYSAKPSDSAYGTFDQGGNLWEWDEAIFYTSYRGHRGGCGSSHWYLLHSYHRFSHYGDATDAYHWLGFRVGAVIPEPLTMLGMILGVGGLAGYIRGRRSRKEVVR